SVWGQGRHRECGPHRPQATVLSHPRRAGHRGARGPPLPRHDHGEGGALRAAQPPGAELPPARGARRRGHDVAQDRRPGKGVLHRAAAAGDRHRGAPVSDRVLATESAQFGCPEVQRGFVPAIVMTLLKRTVGEKVAFDLVATGRIVTASEAAGLGFVSRVYEDSDFEEQAGEVLRALSTASASALAFTKQQFYELDGLRFEDGIRLAADVNAVSRTTP